jgi:hypothetical protein
MNLILSSIFICLILVGVVLFLWGMYKLITNLVPECLEVLAREREATKPLRSLGPEDLDKYFTPEAVAERREYYRKAGWFEEAPGFYVKDTKPSDEGDL